MRLIAAIVALALAWPMALAAHETEFHSATESSAPRMSRAERVQEVLMQALNLIGVRYRWGGESPDTGFDCSGLVMYLFNEGVNRALPRTAAEMSRHGRNVARNQLEPGDLVFFNTLRRPFSHVGIYLGEGRFIHSPARGGQVEIVDMTGHYWQRRYNGARRIDI